MPARLRRVARRQRLPTLRPQLKELLRVDLLASGPQCVATVAVVADDTGAEQVAQLMHERTQVRRCRWRGAIRPELVDEPFGRHRLPELAEQHGQQQALLWRAQRGPLTADPLYLYRA